jgi:hypothetical protein
MSWGIAGNFGESWGNAGHDWYTIVSFGGGSQPRGPWHSEDAAHEAMDRWYRRRGHYAGTEVAAHSIRVVGPFCTRRAAQETDISTYLEDSCHHQERP